ncbi:flagellar assembly factor FliW [Austwickia chelonae]|uniref:Flagellar assembly factor FliW n=1 Tax=Austwickia chelonae NBRC 105200 TaxID=1184607 RepID=K6V9W8_9MICO|nr:flagellar assembly protein FliW [Austwickia chelonae]GAB78998.1 flagellar assembly factor FliW [Austwickia chelonae NBRC 105200]SEV88042.1 flagellar assembly factor FliW [Austwickia chelonae]
MTATAERTSATVHMPAGMVGFPESTEFSLVEIESGVYEMLSSQDDELGFVVITPEPYFPDYDPIIDKATAERLEITDPSDAVVLLVVNIGSEEEAPVANLLAPIIVNKATHTATQVVLGDQEWPLRATIPLG